MKKMYIILMILWILLNFVLAVVNLFFAIHGSLISLSVLNLIAGCLLLCMVPILIIVFVARLKLQNIIINNGH